MTFLVTFCLMRSRYTSSNALSQCSQSIGSGWKLRARIIDPESPHWEASWLIPISFDTKQYRIVGEPCGVLPTASTSLTQLLTQCPIVLLGGLKQSSPAAKGSCRIGRNSGPEEKWWIAAVNLASEKSSGKHRNADPWFVTRTSVGKMLI
jgi:hypothetical protein